MKLYYIYEASTERGKTYYRVLEEACTERGFEFCALDAETVDIFSLPELTDGDALYRHGLSKQARTIEKMLIHEGVSTFHKTWRGALGRRASSYYYMEKAGLPVIKTIPLVPRDFEGLQKAVEHLGGFPLVLKVLGRSHGEGVLKVDSMDALKSLVGYMHSTNETFFLRQFVAHDHYGRLVVVGDRVVGSHKTYVSESDFRTNAAGNREENKMPATFSEELQQIAVSAVHSLGLECGGVDLLFAESGDVYIAEVNFPCGFESTQRIGEVDVAGPMVDFLKEKATQRVRD